MSIAITLAVFLTGALVFFVLLLILSVLSTAYVPSEWPHPALEIVGDELNRRGWGAGLDQTEDRIRRVRRLGTQYDAKPSTLTAPAAILTLTGRADTARQQDLLARRAQDVSNAFLGELRSWAQQQDDVDQLLRKAPSRLLYIRCRFTWAAWRELGGETVKRIQSRFLDSAWPPFLGALIGVLIPFFQGLYGAAPSGGESLNVVGSCATLAVLVTVVWVAVSEARDLWRSLIPQSGSPPQRGLMVLVGLHLFVASTMLCLQAVGGNLLQRWAEVSTNATAQMPIWVQTLLGAALMGACCAWFMLRSVQGARAPSLPMSVRLRNGLRAAFFLSLLVLFAAFALDTITAIRVPESVRMASIYAVPAVMLAFGVVELVLDLERFVRNLRAWRRHRWHVERGWFRPWLATGALVYFVAVPAAAGLIPETTAAVTALLLVILLGWVAALVIIAVQAVAFHRWRRRLQRGYDARLRI